MANQTATRADRMFRAFSDETRLRILHLLVEGELCVGDLVAILRVPQPTASRHLAYLKRAGLVTHRKERLWSFYALSSPRMVLHKKLLECLGCCLDGVPKIKADVVRAKSVRKSGGCCPKPRKL